MHGIIFQQLRKYVEDNIGKNGWLEVQKKANTPTKMYLPISEYPDEEAKAIIGAISTITNTSTQEFLEIFGEYIAPTLMSLYKDMIKPHWKTLDLIENTEQTMHKVARIKDPNANPPRLQCKRISPNEALLTYTSRRKMCALAKGIALGIAKHYGEQIQIKDPKCMLYGDSSCQLLITLKKNNIT